MTRPHVVQVVRSDAFAGVERYIVDTATELRNRGWLVTVIGGQADRMRAELPADVAYHPAVTVVDVTRALWRVGRCDVVHAHMTAAELPAAVLKVFRRQRLVITRHFATQRGRSVPGRVVARFIERQLDVQIAISRYVADSTDSPCVVIHNGVTPSDRSLPRDQVVLVLQRLQQEKDTALALRAWAQSGQLGAGWRLVIRGRGAEEPALRALANDLGVTASVDFAGFTDEPRLALARAAALLATARAEPFGLAVVEAMAEATPVIASNSGAHPETLGADGVYFAAGNVTECAAALARLAASPITRAEVGERLRKRQRELFSVSAHVDRLEREYQLMSTSDPRRSP